MRTLILSFLLLATAAAVGPAKAQQDEGQGTSYITPFPENDIYRLLVVGDSLADGLVEGLIEVFASDSRLQINRSVRTFNGLARSDFEGEMKAFVDAIAKEPVHVAVLLMGVYDRQPLRNPAGKRVPIASEEWKALYSQRADQLMRALKRRGAAVYWVGMPVLRRPEANEAAQIMNDVVRDRAYLNGVKFVDVQPGTADEAGNYNPYGPDLTGKIKLLREPDGIHFTPAGSRKLAHFIERDIKRDLTQAKSDRNIPLAGSETEQKRINPASSAATSPPNAAAPPGGAPNAAAKAAGKDGRPSAGAAPGSAGAPPGPAVPSGPVEQKGEVARITFKVPGANGKEESITADIVRPAIPASVIALVTRRESPDRASQVGESLPDTLPGGLMLLNSVTPSGPGQRRRLAPTQMPYFRVLVKGERVTPKPGRLDDHKWPRPEPEPVTEADAAAAARAATPRPGTRNFPQKGAGPAPRG